ncbi:hypothetical protein ACIP9H_34085 [Streptomyces sp. NPDC088732]|uniref:hypothetical protein n=1 Tax=Streptomyces sp. NPDC088732 TaxID=3365879 RepID=UPI0037F2BEAA
MSRARHTRSRAREAAIAARRTTTEELLDQLRTHILEEQRLADESGHAASTSTQALERHRAAAEQEIRRLEAERDALNANLATALKAFNKVTLQLEDAQASAADGAADEPVRLQCVYCGDPVQWADHVAGGWTHRPGSDTSCVEAHPNDEGLRAQFEAAIRQWADESTADLENASGAVMNVRDQRMEQLVAGRLVWKRKAREMEADRDRQVKARVAAEEQAREATAAALRLRSQTPDAAQSALNRVRNARTWGEAWTVLGMYFGLSPEVAGQEARDRRTAAEREAEGRAAAMEAQRDDWARRCGTADGEADNARFRRDQVAAALREVLAAFSTTEVVAGQVAGHLAPHPIHPVQFAGWRKVLEDLAVAEEGTVCDSYVPPNQSEASGLCAGCGMHDWKHAAEAERVAKADRLRALIGAVEVRKPCPYCPPPKMLPEHLMVEHLRDVHGWQQPETPDVVGPQGAGDRGTDPGVQCWHFEAGTPCDFNVCRQPDRLAAGDAGTDPAVYATGC